MTQVVRLSDYRHRRGRVYFTRAELSQLLSLYSVRVARGEWRDYAIDYAVGIAVFSVFRHSQDRPVYAIAKMVGPKDPEFCIFEGRGRVRRSSSLADVLDFFDTQLRVVTD